jgi:hypothetical protein
MDDVPRRSAPPRTDEVISEERFQRYHHYAREKGVNRLMYFIARLLLTPAFLLWFRLERQGREHARVPGGMVVASNHRSFLDPARDRSAGRSAGSGDWRSRRAARFCPWRFTGPSTCAGDGAFARGR